MDSRKRPHAEDELDSRSKKRAVSDDNRSPSHVNGVTPDGDEPKDGDNLEMFRKDAIYRRMKHYSRENERSQARIAELERRRHTCEAGLAALEACWTQIISTIRLLVKSEDLPPLNVQTEDIFDLTARVSEHADSAYLDALRDKMHATSELVTAFARLSGQSQSVPSQDEVYRRCQAAETDCSTLRSELSLIRTRLRDSELEKERYHEELVAAEKRVDRLQSRTLATIHSIPVKEEVKDEDSPRETPVPPASAQAVVNGSHSDDSAGLQDVLQRKEEDILRLTKETSALHLEIQDLKLQLQSPPEDVVIESLYYKLLQEQASKLEYSATHSENELQRVKEELEQLQASHAASEKEVATAIENAVKELKTRVTNRDNDNIRLREQRDQAMAELNERKAKDSVKMQSLQELKTLAESRGASLTTERIAVLHSELTRLRTRLAADAGDEDLVTFLFKDNAGDSTYVDDLRKRLVAAEEKADALQQSLSSLQKDNPDAAAHARVEAELREELAHVRVQLEKYQTVYGEASTTLPPDLQHLSQQLQEKEDVIEKVRLQVKQREQAESALYSELDRLSVAWETLDRQVRNKVFDLGALEEKLQKAVVDRAKSENKFYSAMRDKEAVENERKNLSRKSEKQQLAIDKYKETETHLSNRMAECMKELEGLRKGFGESLREVKLLKEQVGEWRIRTDNESKRVDELRAIMVQHEHDLERRRNELRKAEENLVRSRKEAERQSAKLKASSNMLNSTASSREAQLQQEVDKCMSILKCSTCRINMRNTVITKCMHSFCKQCVESRISTRQRKCPACNLPFSQGEVQALFFQ
ncbi:BRE1-domain-containing protein [Obba rivulosa]|uniref:E3 ubiquitin protein ligase n=1 Tax=Obba rivulosa TaxID=1052685 RepID=A0A8E2AXF3_9APHY|nr:BRE1-domain-containing protein [Obba rivulosa]